VPPNHHACFELSQNPFSRKHQPEFFFHTPWIIIVIVLVIVIIVIVKRSKVNFNDPIKMRLSLCFSLGWFQNTVDHKCQLFSLLFFPFQTAQQTYNFSFNDKKMKLDLFSQMGSSPLSLNGQKWKVDLFSQLHPSPPKHFGFVQRGGLSTKIIHSFFLNRVCLECSGTSRAIKEWTQKDLWTYGL
jgi:hypothetical protein